MLETSSQAKPKDSFEFQNHFSIQNHLSPMVNNKEKKGKKGKRKKKVNVPMNIKVISQVTII